MNPNEPTDLERCDTDLPSDARLLGVDGEGATHYMNTGARRIWVIVDGVVDEEQDLGDRSLETWISYVETKRGEWVDLRYDDRPFDEWLLDALELAPAQEAC